MCRLHLLEVPARAFAVMFKPVVLLSPQLTKGGVVNVSARAFIAAERQASARLQLRMRIHRSNNQ